MKILMVCLGNICRSPLAHGILQQLANQQKLNWKISSAGTANWHQGKSPDPRGIAAAKALGYNISNQKAQHFSAKFFAEYDLIFVMDQNNYTEVTRLAKSQADIEKVKFFLDNGDLPDPYYNDEWFEPICKQVENRCKALINLYTT